ncbi:MAG: PocR ligand-binding domain-containing protein [Deltaproteobacteria bacterium]|nr:PocR ligand-binding domain-containing protein [Deltaproteobacteria bacterium]
MINVYDINGTRITDNTNWANRLCPLIKANDKGINFICAIANMNMASQAKLTGKPIIEECDAGLVKICAFLELEKIF